MAFLDRFHDPGKRLMFHAGGRVQCPGYRRGGYACQTGDVANRCSHGIPFFLSRMIVIVKINLQNVNLIRAKNNNVFTNYDKFKRFA